MKSDGRADLYSRRFGKFIRVTRHAIKRMEQRHISDVVLLDLIESGKLKLKDQKHGWIFKEYSDRSDNMICAAIVLEARVIVKTVMHHFEEI